VFRRPERVSLVVLGGEDHVLGATALEKGNPLGGVEELESEI
jgi:hypothetical protein